MKLPLTQLYNERAVCCESSTWPGFEELDLFFEDDCNLNDSPSKGGTYNLPPVHYGGGTLLVGS